MGGRTHKAGHQHVYYCVQKEREWKTRGDDHPKWKRGIGCSMVRSVNIEMTNRLVWSMVKDALLQIRNRPLETGEGTGPDHHTLDDECQVHTDGISWMSPDQIDHLSDEEKKTIISKMVTNITVHLNTSTKKHCVTVVFSEFVTRALAPPCKDLPAEQPEEDRSEGVPVSLSNPVVPLRGGDTAKKLRGSGQVPAADHAYSVTVE